MTHSFSFPSKETGTLIRCRWRHCFRKALPRLTQLVGGSARIWFQLSDTQYPFCPLRQTNPGEAEERLCESLGISPKIWTYREQSTIINYLLTRAEFMGQAYELWASSVLSLRRKEGPAWTTGALGRDNPGNFSEHKADCSPRCLLLGVSPFGLYQISRLGFCVALFLSWL